MGGAGRIAGTRKVLSGTDFALRCDTAVYKVCDMKYELNAETGRRWYNLTGDVFGRWTVLGFAGRLMTAGGVENGATRWLCRCECGKERVVNYAALRGGVSRSCGCLRGEVLGLRAKKHGDSNCKAYVAWQQAKDRCFNQNRPAWNNYGGRGVTMCEGFRENYTAWRDALGPAPSPKHSVDRRDNSGNYSCGLCSQCVDNRWKFNIHWATSLEQGNNRRSNRKFMWEGCLRGITEIARMENVAFCSLRNRVIQDGMRVEAAVADLRARGMIYNERAKCILEANQEAVTRSPKRRRRKSVPNSVD